MQSGTIMRSGNEPPVPAALVHSLTANHALVDGNKRLALHLSRIFLVPNGWDIDLTQDEKVDLIVDIATGLADLDKIETRFRLARR